MSFFRRICNLVLFLLICFLLENKSVTSVSCGVPVMVFNKGVSYKTRAVHLLAVVRWCLIKVFHTKFHCNRILKLLLTKETGIYDGGMECKGDLF